MPAVGLDELPTPSRCWMPATVTAHGGPVDTGTRKPLLGFIALEPPTEDAPGAPRRRRKSAARNSRTAAGERDEAPGPGAPPLCALPLADPARRDATWGPAGGQPSWSPEKRRRGQDRHLLRASPSPPRVPGKPCGTPALQDWWPCPMGITPKDPCDSDRLSCPTNSLPWE